ncbi:Zn(II)2Cys6 transcription factor [Aspergillus homomorphus CBS 101889]|uniref:Zn(II)2Cys6 transcription factor n=1 Tax=Aspergillus homomorphus (strain CBS 101889) TaxID=1450537 RepID=A0A395I9B5_ASPHC|nr:Zn(II)2Cys6 transcription factor [Aspergillus homomorphus CBS 101889]RAL16757.1 Zn(II)2Cys6 transcription factor [Aspergillus homomorphus CBS 101889]
MKSHDDPPRKRRCGKERVRVTRACDACKRKKLRCSGTLPCSLCQRTGRSCDYTAEYNRGKLPPIPSREQPTTPPRTETTTDCTLESPASSLREDGFVNGAASRNSPEAHQTDMEGHYVGPSSGVSFLIRAQRRLHEQISLPINAPIFSFGDAPLSNMDPAFLLLPPRSDADVLVARYFDFAFPTHRFLHQSQVECWISEFYGPLQDSAVAGPDKRSIRALVLMVLAHAKQCLAESDQGIGASVNGTLYLAAAEHHLAAETGPVRLTSVQARLAQCFYLLSQSRINHCWSLFGTTARLAIAIGLHRARRRDRSSSFDYVDGECRKRVFWCAYSLDNYLSAALGRPRIFHDDDIDQELPTVANDAQIKSDQILPAATSAQSIMLAPVYHAKLSVIIGGILHDVYGARRASGQVEVAAAAKYGAGLSRWRQELSSFLDLPSVDLLMLTYQRQYTVLNLAFYHAQILLYRPFILKDFGLSIATPRSQSDRAVVESTRKYTELCLEAAMKIAAIVRELCNRRRMYSTFWFTHYYAFSAIVVLYVRVVQGSTLVNRSDQLRSYLRIAEQAQRDLALCGPRSSFAQRYVVVLEELRKEARAAINRTRPSVVTSEAPLPSSLRSPSQQGLASTEPRHIAKPGVSHSMFDIQTMQVSMRASEHQWMDPTSAQLHPQPSQGNPVSDGLAETGMMDVSDWGAVDSLAAAGLGELDYLFPFEGFQGA